MKELPILFSSEMVKAILDGRKTQTRRVIKKGMDSIDIIGAKHIEKNIWRPVYQPSLADAERITHEPQLKSWIIKCPYKVGDRLWVKETYNDFEHPYYRKPRYKATDENYYNAKWKFSRFMPKKYARIWLEVTGVRVERLKEISDNDIICEGFETREDFYGTIIKLNRAKNPEKFLGKWVWVYEFKRSK